MNAGSEGMQNLPVGPKVPKVRMDAGDGGMQEQTSNVPELLATILQHAQK
jgi:hypothetical protein